MTTMSQLMFHTMSMSCVGYFVPSGQLGKVVSADTASRILNYAIRATPGPRETDA